MTSASKPAGAQLGTPSGRRRRRRPSRPPQARPRARRAIAGARPPRRGRRSRPFPPRRSGPVNTATTPASGRGPACPRRRGSHSTASARSASAQALGARRRRAAAAHRRRRAAAGRRRGAARRARPPRGTTPASVAPPSSRRLLDVAAAELVERGPDALRSLARADDDLDAGVGQRVDGGRRRLGAGDHDHRRLGGRPHQPAVERQPGARSRRRRGSAAGRRRPRVR